MKTHQVGSEPLLKRTILVTLAVAIAALVALALSTASGPGSGSSLKVERRDLTFGVETEGELRATKTVLLGPPQIQSTWNFKISMLATDGQSVEEGTPVLAFDATELERKLQERQARAESTQKELSKVTTDLEIAGHTLELELAEAEGRLRQAQLRAGVTAETTASRELEKARIDLQLAGKEIEAINALLVEHKERERSETAAFRKKVATARQTVEQLRQDVAAMTIVAPRSGTVVLREDWRGNKMDVGDDVWRAQKILEIPDLTKMEGAALVNEQAAGLLREDLVATLALESQPDHEYQARILSIRRSIGRKSPQSPEKVVRVVLALDETDTERMRPGMRFRGTIVTDTAVNVLALPLNAINSNPDGRPYVDTIGTFGKRKVFPVLGRRNTDYVEVLSGISEGTRVVSSGADK